MSLRHWIFAVLVGYAALCSVATASAQDAPKLAQQCIDAKITDQAACDALLKKLGKLPHKPADKTDAKTDAKTGPKPESKTGAAAAASTPALPKACIDAGVKTQADCDTFEAAQHAKEKAASIPKTPDAALSPKGPTPAAAPPLPAANAPASVMLPKDCLAAGITTRAACDALHSHQNATRKPLPSGQSASVKTGPATSSVTSAGAPTSPATNAPKLSADCIAAALTTKADCDALHAAEKSKAKANASTPDSKPTASSTPPVTPPATTTPTPPASPSTSEHVSLAKDCLAAGLKTQADCAALHLTRAHATPSPSPQPVASPPPAQPKEVIPALPKGVTQAQVAPLLDSAKQGKGTGAPTAAPAAAPAAPPPTSDKTAQVALAAPPPTRIDTQQGKPITKTSSASAIQLPPSVTIVNQTVINNTVINNNAAPLPAPPANPIGLSIGVVLQIGNGQVIVDSSGRDQYRIAEQDRDHTDYEQLPRGRYRETVTRPDGTRIVTIYDRDGDVLRRSRFNPDGTEVVLAYFDDTQDADLGQWRDPGDDLPPLRLQVPVEDYVLDADHADEGQIQLFFDRPPVEPLRRLYSISEVERSARLRDIVPRVELGGLTFDTGSANLGPDQIGALSDVAHAMLGLLQRNPAETFLIEGHTDAVGTAASNLVLSDARAASVAQILTEAYHIPPENLATQGYGSSFLKIQTDGPERLNRRVVIRRITPLITVASSQ